MVFRDTGDHQRGRAKRWIWRHQQAIRALPKLRQHGRVQLQQIAIDMLRCRTALRNEDVTAIGARPFDPFVHARAGRADTNRRRPFGRTARSLFAAIQRPFLIPVRHPPAYRMVQHVPNVIDVEADRLTLHRTAHAPEPLRVLGIGLRGRTVADHLDRRQIEPLAEQIDVDQLQNFPSRESPQNRRTNQFRGLGGHSLRRHARRAITLRGLDGQFDADGKRDAELARSDP